MRGWLRRALVGLALVSFVALPSAERHYLYRGRGAGDVRASAAATSALRTGVTTRTFVAVDGTPVRALALPQPADPAAKTVVLFHNNRETAEQQLDVAQRLHARGLGVVVVEYRGYGGSRDAGLPTEEGLYMDAEAVLGMLERQGLTKERTILFGISLGTGVATEMARRGHGSALVLVSPYTSIPELVEDASGVPAHYILPDRFETAEKAAAIELPTLVVHGDADEIVPFWMGEKLSQTFTRGLLLRVPGGHHGDLFARAGAEVVDHTASL